MQSPARAGAVCPYCGHGHDGGKECGACGGLFEPLSRQATQNAMGPWFIRDAAQPFRPGCSYTTIRALAMKGKLGPETVVRGPSTRQFWMQARRTPGLAHILGACHACKRAAVATETACSSCGVSFEVSTERQMLGLSEVRLLPGRATAAQIAAGAMKGQGIGLAAGAGAGAGAWTAAAVETSGVELEPVALEAHAEAGGAAVETGRSVYDQVERPRERAVDWGEREEPRGARRGRTTVLVLASMASVGAMVMLAVFAMLLSQALKASRTTTAPGPVTTLPTAAGGAGGAGGGGGR